MGMRGRCECGNIEVDWQVVDYSLAPRACQCDYCRERGAAWVSKSGSRFTATVHRPEQHRVATHGSGRARFHECTHCGQPVFVTAEIDGDLYGVLNAGCLRNPQGFPLPVEMDFSGQDPDQKRERWQRNWCGPVRLRGL